MVNSDMPTVGVLIPSYNHANYIRSRIESVLKQTFQNIYVYIVDDCSTDDSWEIIKKFNSDPRVSIFRSESPSGSPFTYYRRFISEYSHDYWWIAESDDLADANFLSSLLKNFEDDDELLFSFCGSKVIDLDGKQIGSARNFLKEHFAEVDWEVNQKITSNMGLNMLMRGQFVPNMSSMIFKTNAIELSDLDRIKRFKLTGDWVFVILLQSAGPGLYVSEELNYFRSHNDTARTRTGSRSRTAEYLFCNISAWTKTDKKSSVLVAVQDTFAMSRDINIKLFHLYLSLYRISKSSAYSLVQNLILEFFAHPMTYTAKALRYFGITQKIIGEWYRFRYFIVGHLRHLFFLYGVVKRKKNHYFFLLGVVFRKIGHLSRFAIYVLKIIIFRPALASRKIKKRLTSLKNKRSHTYLLRDAPSSMCASKLILRSQKGPITSKCLLIDRDGTLVEHIPYLINPSDVVFIKEVIEMIRVANSKAIPVYIVTNQAGVNHGFFDEIQLAELNFEILNDLLDDHQVYVDGIFWCISHPTPKNKRKGQLCDCRKPHPGLLLEAMQEARIDSNVTGMVGDSESDISAAINAGLKYTWLVSKTNREQVKESVINWLSRGTAN
jgi:D,D-heptose 1,7-bisphosphate phosphatase